MTRFAAVPIVLAALLAGCGSSDVGYEEVPGPPPALTIPHDTSTPTPTPTATQGSAGSADGTGTTTDATAADPATSTGGTSTEAAAVPDTTATDTATSTGGSGTTDSGGTAAPGAVDGPTNDTPPEPGSQAQQFEEFCQQNAGAC
jgi:hypothetical protein